MTDTFPQISKLPAVSAPAVFDPQPLPAPSEIEDAAPSWLDSNPRYLVARAFHSRFLKDDRDISIFLPEAYLAEPTRRFPVFYLHDGQNLFDGRTSYVVNRTWRAGTTADDLAARGLIEPVILVGIANTGVRRMAEYTPTRAFRLGGGEGGRYGRLLVEDLKPAIDSCFRTLPDAANTGLGGSSLGGLITLALGLDYSNIFGKLAVCSPSVWWDNRSILALVNDAKPKPALKIWLDMGTAEGLRHLRDTDLLHRRLELRGWREGVDLAYMRAPGAVHDEEAWAARFDQVLRLPFPAAQVKTCAQTLRICAKTAILSCSVLDTCSVALHPLPHDPLNNIHVLLRGNIPVLMIRLSRVGARKQPHYRVVVIEKDRARNGRSVEVVGTYNPRTEPTTIILKRDRVDYWVSKGAQLSETVGKLLKKHTATAGAAGASEPVETKAPAVTESEPVAA